MRLAPIMRNRTAKRVRQDRQKINLWPLFCATALVLVGSYLAGWRGAVALAAFIGFSKMLVVALETCGAILKGRRTISGSLVRLSSIPLALSLFCFAFWIAR